MTFLLLFLIESSVSALINKESFTLILIAIGFLVIIAESNF